MDEYHGSAELLDSKGNVVDRVSVFLQSRPTTGIRQGSWGGHIEPTTLEGGNWDTATRIRLKDDREADIIVTKENIRSTDGGDATREGTLRGSGPPPF